MLSRRLLPSLTPLLSTPSSSSSLSVPCSFFSSSFGSFEYEKQATELRRGDLIDHKGEAYEVREANVSRKGKTNAFVQMTLKHVFKGTNSNTRFRTDDDITVFETEVVTCQIKSWEKNLKLKKKIAKLLCEIKGDEDSDLSDFSDDDEKEEGEELVVDLGMLEIPQAVEFAEEGMEILVTVMEGEIPIKVRFPDITCKIASAGHAEPGTKLVVLENGVSVKAPHHAEIGEEVVVRLPEVRVMDVLKG